MPLPHTTLRLATLQIHIGKWNHLDVVSASIGFDVLDSHKFKLFYRQIISWALGMSFQDVHKVKIFQAFWVLCR